MILFSGEIDSKIQARIITKRSRFAGILSLICAIAGLISCLIYLLIVGVLDSQMITILICSVILIIVSVILSIPTNKNRLGFIWNFDIKIEKDIITLVFNHQNGVVQTFKTDKIKKVIDYGKYYYISFYRLDPSNGIVCQKDLLTCGTIEEFEKFFEGKIKRKINK